MDDYSISGLIGARVRFQRDEADEVIGTVVRRHDNHMVVIETDTGSIYFVSASEVEVINER